jgi:ABC-type microcin C transport system duplicated ATPase subunit YejF
MNETRAFFDAPTHPYSKRLFESVEKRIQTPLRAGKGILLDVHANKRAKISSCA